MGRTFSSPLLERMEDGTFFIYEIPIGAIGTGNQSFTLTYAPAPANTLEVFLNGAALSVTEDYTLVGDTLTLNIAPPTGSILKVQYHVNP